jgi:hypothetical protein
MRRRLRSEAPENGLRSGFGTAASAADGGPCPRETKDRLRGIQPRPRRLRRLAGLRVNERASALAVCSRWRRCLSGLRPIHQPAHGVDRSHGSRGTFACSARRRRCGDPSGDRIAGSAEHPSGCDASGASTSRSLRGAGESRQRVKPVVVSASPSGGVGRRPRAPESTGAGPVARPSTGIVRAPLRGPRARWAGDRALSAEVQRTSTRRFLREVLRHRRDPSGCAFGCGRGTVLRGGTSEPGSDPGAHPQGCDHRAERNAGGLRVTGGPDWYATAFGRSAASTALGARQAENLAFHVALGRRDTEPEMDPDREMGMDHLQAPTRRGRHGTCR